jgi:hypothetical protein
MDWLLEQKGYEPKRNRRNLYLFCAGLLPEVAVSVQFAPRGANSVDVRSLDRGSSSWIGSETTTYRSVMLFRR